MHRVLVTGAAGFVGRHVTRHLLEQGHETHAVDSIVPGTGAIHPEWGWPLFEPRDFRSFFFHEMDCRDYFAQEQADDFEYALHLAAIVGGRETIENHPLAVAEDLAIDAAYWKWAAQRRPAKTLTFSSSAAYPVEYQRRTGFRLLREDMIRFDGPFLGLPDMTYGWAKLTSEYLGRLAFERHGLRSVAYRPFSGYGEDQDLSYPFPSLCRKAIEGRGAARLTVWGSGDQLRDFIHIDDVVAAIFAFCDRIEDGEAVNLSTGSYTSMKELARRAAAVCGYRPEVVGDVSRPAGVFARAGDTAKQRSLGFEPRVSLDEGVRRGVAFLEQRLRSGEPDRGSGS